MILSLNKLNKERRVRERKSCAKSIETNDYNDNVNGGTERYPINR